jgi:hypothetical protein
MSISLVTGTTYIENNWICAGNHSIVFVSKRRGKRFFIIEEDDVIVQSYIYSYLNTYTHMHASHVREHMHNIYTRIHIHARTHTHTRTHIIHLFMKAGRHKRRDSSCVTISSGSGPLLWRSEVASILTEPLSCLFMSFGERSDNAFH